MPPTASPELGTRSACPDQSARKLGGGGFRTQNGRSTMPLDDYEGMTFVAFTDISGFREMMLDRKKAIQALDAFYQAGFDILNHQTGRSGRVDGLFVSDCGVLFVRSADAGTQNALNLLLAVIESLNRRLLQAQVMLTTSVAYGQFSYHQRLEFPGIEKNPIYGNGYLDAYLDTNIGRPKIQPGQCRLVCRGLPDELAVSGSEGRLAPRSGEHRYFYWMVSAPAGIPAFERQYGNAYLLKYKGMLDALRDAVTDTPGSVSRQ
jgi:hypothetical protein